MVNTTKGTDLANRLLLMQYQPSPIYNQYKAAFVDEMDLLFEQVERVYLGRFIENAVGTQLDIIGIILDEDRDVSLPTQFFGFSNNGAIIANVASFADEATPAEGGVFRSEEQTSTSNSSLGDIVYRKLLLAKAYLSTQQVCSFDVAYHALATLLGRVPVKFELTSIGARQVQLEVDSTDVSLNDVSYISYFSQYLVPLGTSFTINRI